MRNAWLAFFTLGLMACGSMQGGSDAGTDGGRPADAPPPSTFVDPACTDGRYFEPLPDTSASLADIAFDPADLPGYYDAVLTRRYPNGAAIVRGGRVNTSARDCVLAFTGTRSLRPS